MSDEKPTPQTQPNQTPPEPSKPDEIQNRIDEVLRKKETEKAEMERKAKEEQEKKESLEEDQKKKDELLKNKGFTPEQMEFLKPILTNQEMTQSELKKLRELEQEKSNRESLSSLKAFIEKIPGINPDSIDDVTEIMKKHVKDGKFDQEVIKKELEIKKHFFIVPPGTVSGGKNERKEINNKPLTLEEQRKALGRTL